jgi:protein SCO1/2
MALVLSALCIALAARAEPTPDIGIDEKLGRTIARDTTLVDERGDRVVIGELIDKPTILTLNYFRCPGLCSPLLHGVAEVVGKLELRPGVDYQVLTVSFDPRDDAELAAAKKDSYLSEMGGAFPPQAWRFLTGDPASTRRLADSVGFKFAKVDLDYVHPAAIIVLSPKGRVARYLYGISYLPFDLRMALLEAAEGRAGPTINRLLMLCFAYDPQGRTYSVAVTRLAGVLMLLVALGFGAVLIVRRRRAP